MGKQLASQVIAAACRELLKSDEGVSVREVQAHLQATHGSAGRTERVARILKAAVHEQGEAPVLSTQVQQLQHQLTQALKRARIAEERERAHQDFWADRYATKITELEAQYTKPKQEQNDRLQGQILKLYQRIADLTGRLAQYEEVPPVIQKTDLEPAAGQVQKTSRA